MDFGKIITKAWVAFLEYKILWLFGIIGSLLSVLTSLPGYFRSEINFNQWTDLYGYAWGYTESNMSVFDYARDHLFLFTVLVVFAVLLFILISTMLQTFSLGGLNIGYLRLESEWDQISFSGVVSEFRPFFWRLFGLNLLLGSGGLGVLFILMVILAALTITTMGLGMLCFFPLFCLLIPLLWFFGIVINQTMVVMIAEDLGIKDSIVQGWSLVTSKVGPYILIWLIVLVISLVVGFVIAIPTMIPSISTFSMMMSSDLADQPDLIINRLRPMLIWSLLWMPISAALNGVVMAFFQSIWVQTYLEARGNGTLEPQEDPVDFEDQETRPPGKLEQIT
jgi:hypothetical protein